MIRIRSETRYYPLGYVPALDGMRGIMTMGVLFAHIHYRYIPGVVLYMDVFFVMSGYYITSLLLRDIEHHGRIRFGEFYRRRFSRILPPFAVMLAAYLITAGLFVNRGIIQSFHAALVVATFAFTYTMNFHNILVSTAGFLGSLGHTWSLSIEEQYYLLWPVMLAFLAGWLGVSWRLVGVICAIALTVWLWRIWLASTGADIERLYYGFDTRADSLMVGCALAVALKLASPGTFPMLDRTLPKLAWPLLIASTLLTFFAFGEDRPEYYLYASMVCGALPGALLLTLLVRTSGTVCHRIFERPEALFLGQIFYGVYLWHYPIYFFLTDIFKLEGLSRIVILLVVGVPLTLLIATLSYFVIERRFMRARHFIPKVSSERALAEGSQAVYRSRSNP